MVQCEQEELSGIMIPAQTDCGLGPASSCNSRQTETCTDSHRSSNNSHAGMYDTEDDPDRLYYSRGLGALDSETDSGDDSASVGDASTGWGDEDEVSLRMTNEV